RVETRQRRQPDRPRRRADSRQGDADQSGARRLEHDGRSLGGGGESGWRAAAGIEPARRDDRAHGSRRARRPAVGRAHERGRRDVRDRHRQGRQTAPPQDHRRHPRCGQGADHRRPRQRATSGDHRRVRALQARCGSAVEGQGADRAGERRRRARRDVMSATADERSEQYWFARHSKSIIFLICILAVIGVYEAFTLPVAVFPTTNFPRIIIGVDNGVTPIEQMEVTITRPLEEAVRTVPGLQDVRSVTSRGSAEINLFFDWSVDMLETLQLVDAAVSRVQRTLPPTAQIRTHRLDFSSFPIIGYSLTSDTVPQTDLWELATYEIKPRLNRLPGVASILIQGGQRPEFHAIVDPAQMIRAKTSIADIVNAVNRTNVIDSPGLLSRNHQLFLGLVDAQVHSVEDVGNVVIKHV